MLKSLLLLLTCSYTFWTYGQVYILNSRQNEESTWDIITSEFIKDYESDNLIYTKRLKEDLTFCNPRLKKAPINSLIRSNRFDYCLNKSYLSFGAGLGSFNFHKEYKEENLKFNLEAFSYHFNIALKLSSNLHSLNIIDFDFVHLEALEIKESHSSKKIRFSNPYALTYTRQTRVRNTPFSSRLGLSFRSTPTQKLRKNGTTIDDLMSSDVKAYHFLLGIKFSDRKTQGGKQIFTLDYLPQFYVHEDMGINSLQSYDLHLRYFYNFDRYLAASLNYTYGELYLKDSEMTKSEISLLVHIYPF